MLIPVYRKNLLVLLGFCLASLPTLGQIFRLDTALNVPKEAGLHTISGLDFIPEAGVWQLVGDRGEQWRTPSLTHYEQAMRGPNTGLQLEALRYDAASRTYFGTVEENDAGSSYAFFCHDSLPRADQPKSITVFNRITPLPFHNKGIEGLALGADSTVWLAPEAGWAPTDGNQPTVQFYRYNWSGTSLSNPKQFGYPRDQMPALASSERYGGISEILWSGRNTLLVLERFYDGSRDSSFAKLYEVTFVENTSLVAPAKKLVFDFNTMLKGSRIDNLEGMAWMPAQLDRQRLVIISDDNGGDCPREKGGKCQYTQLIFLSR
ncbi:esterase-like activity of phytase family protein [Fibrella forsythiae]|uniref:Esterase-like activity of phytase family protein n=1 Tax=Fibrella forsythiae TaxID=2817061 RepID=A0ABS3JPW2_9BACT|nr:esterase-like activity of phytase family protein [Fibrella forsythiae]MBO0951523.1 esterase-like activity of phytase family protein [Fibrella forsythiae]